MDTREQGYNPPPQCWNECWLQGSEYFRTLVRGPWIHWSIDVWNEIRNEYKKTQGWPICLKRDCSTSWRQKIIFVDSDFWVLPGIFTWLFPIFLMCNLDKYRLISKIYIINNQWIIYNASSSYQKIVINRYSG